MSEIPDLEAIRDHRSALGWDSVWLEMEGGEALDALLAYVAQLQEALREWPAFVEAALLTEQAFVISEADSACDNLMERTSALFPAPDEANQQGPG